MVIVSQIQRRETSIMGFFTKTVNGFQIKAIEHKFEKFKKIEQLN